MKVFAIHCLRLLVGCFHQHASSLGLLQRTPLNRHAIRIAIQRAPAPDRRPIHQAHSKGTAQMKPSMRSMFTVTLITAALGACGGGGSDSSSNDASGKSTASTSIAQMGGTYILPCRGTTFQPSADPSADKSESETATIVITPDTVTGKASISAHHQYYRNSVNCDAATLDSDLTFLGTASDKAGSKNYTNAAGKPVTAKVATIAYSGFTLSRGKLDLSLPTLGATTDMAYVLDNNTLYLSKGRREADGLGDALTRGAVKQ
jgi:hypothetical protein